MFNYRDVKLVILCARVSLYTQEIEVNPNVHLTDAVAQLIERLYRMRKIKVRAPVATELGQLKISLPHPQQQV